MSALRKKEAALNSTAKRNLLTTDCTRATLQQQDDPIDNAVCVSLVDNGEGVRTFTKPNGDKYQVSGLGVDLIKAGKDGESVIKLCDFLEVVCTYCDADSDDWGRCVRWIDRAGVEHTLNIPEGDLVCDATGVLTTLVTGGLNVYAPATQRAQHPIIDYIKSFPAAQRLKSVNSLGWNELNAQDDKGYIFVYPTAQQPLIVGGDGNAVIFNGDSAHLPNYRTKGTLEEWIRKVGIYGNYSSRIGFAICTSFAAILLRLLNEPSGGFHFLGGSSTGKSSALRAACSVFSTAGTGGELGTWRATDNGLELACQTHNDLVMFCDEIGEADPKSLANSVYMIGNETGKKRATKSVTSQRVLSWRVMVLSSGEETIESICAKANGGRPLKTGVDVRLPAIPVRSESEGGMFNANRIPEGMTAAQLADDLRRITETECYGVAGVAFVRHIVGEVTRCGFNDVRYKLSHERDEIRRQISGSETRPAVRRVSNRFATVALAGVLAVRWGLLPVSEADCIAYAKECFEAWVGGFETEEEQSETLAGHLYQSVLQKRDQFDVIDSGTLEHCPAPIVPKLGYIVRHGDNTEECFIEVKTFVKHIVPVQNTRAECLNTLWRHGYLHPASDRQRKTYKIPKGRTVLGVSEGTFVRLTFRKEQ